MKEIKLAIIHSSSNNDKWRLFYCVPGLHYFKTSRKEELNERKHKRMLRNFSLLSFSFEILRLFETKILNIYEKKSRES